MVTLADSVAQEGSFVNMELMRKPGAMDVLYMMTSHTQRRSRMKRTRMQWQKRTSQEIYRLFGGWRILAIVGARGTR
eukprot:jgi/Botrbrau1/21494/Bobra.174_2s0003.1